VVGNWRRDTRRLIGYPLACSFLQPPSFSPRCIPCLLVVPLPLYPVASLVTPRRAHPETDDKVHPTTPIPPARPHTHTDTYTRAHVHTRRYTRERMSRVGIDIRKSEGEVSAAKPQIVLSRTLTSIIHRPPPRREEFVKGINLPGNIASKSRKDN